MKTIAIVYYLLKIADTVLSWAYQQKWYNAGWDAAVAKAAADIWKKTEHANAIHERVRNLTDDKLDELLHSFEPRQLLQDIPPGDNTTGGRIDKSIQGSAGETSIK